MLILSIFTHIIGGIISTDVNFLKFWKKIGDFGLFFLHLEDEVTTFHIIKVNLAIVMHVCLKSAPKYLFWVQ